MNVPALAKVITCVVLVTGLSSLCSVKAEEDIVDVDAIVPVKNTEKEKQFCSFFTNRAPKAQPGLQNCTWFKADSCCLQQEIAATFGRVKPLKGASRACQKYINYLMCYICAPNQNIFYQKERLTVCEQFCNSLYDACKAAILKGSVIGELYENGREFCLSRRFLVDTQGCFTFDVSLDTSHGGGRRRVDISLILLCLLLALCCCCCCCLQALDYLTNQALEPPSQAVATKPGPASITPATAAASIRNHHLSAKSTQLVHVVSGVKFLLWMHLKAMFKFSKMLSLQPYLLLGMVSLAPLDSRCCADAAAAAITVGYVENLSRKLSTELSEFAQRSLQYEAVQHLYDDAQYVTEFVNGTQKVGQVRDKLGKFFSQKQQLAVELSQQVAQLHDLWITNSSDLDLDLELEEVMHTEDLPLGVYMDSDLPHRLPPHLMTFNSEFNTEVLAGHSTVKIAEDTPRDSRATIDSILWTSKLDSVFTNNNQKDPTIRWQYFGSTTGIHRIFPGREWERNFIGFHDDFDPRTRPWYISATSGPKDVVIVIDTSTSMTEGNGFDRAKKVAVNLVGTLTKQDYVNVIVSRSPHWLRNGKYVNVSAEVLGCQAHRLVPASTSHRQELTAAIQALQPIGGSDHVEAFKLGFELLKNSAVETKQCQTFLVFITDGKEMDGDQRCSAGYYRYDTENQKVYVSGELCYYYFETIVNMVPILQHALRKPAHLFTFLMSDHPQSNEILPGRLACDNQGAMATVVNDTNLIHQMMPYFQFLERSAGSREPLWTSPYLDKAGLGLIVTVAVAVYSNLTGSLLGVVGIDVPLDAIEMEIRHNLWGDVYAFLIDRGDGSTVIHPFAKPTAQLLEDPMFIPIYSLETHRFQPEQFHDVLRGLLSGRTGHDKILKNAWRAVSFQDSLLWRRVKSSHYYYTGIPGSAFTICFNLGLSDEVFQHAREPFGPSPITYLHEMDRYANLSYEIPGAYEELSPTSMLRYPGQKVSVRHSVVQLAPRAFCHPSRHLRLQQPSFEETHKFLNTFDITFGKSCPEAQIRPDVRPDVRLSAKAEELWLKRPSDLRQEILWTYLGTMSGVMRIYPGVTLQNAYDPTSRPWYQQAEVNRGMLAVSSVYQNPSASGGKVVTLSRAIHKAKPLTPPDCTANDLENLEVMLNTSASPSSSSAPPSSTAARRDYGCPCTYHSHCKSDYCYLSSCADDIIQGVVALDMLYDDFHAKVIRLLGQPFTDSRANHVTSCGTGKRYTCEGGHLCETKCYLVDNLGHIVMSEDFKNVPAEESYKYEDISLASRHGYLFEELIREEIFIQNTRFDYQGICRFSQDIPEDKLSFHHDLFKDNSVHAKGPIPPFQNKYGCLREVIYYTSNRSRLRDMPDGVYTGSLDLDPCGDGQFFVSLVEETNLILLVLDQYRDHSSSWNINCHITNSVRVPGSFRVEGNACSSRTEDYFSYSLLPRRTCPKPAAVAVPCGFSHSATVDKLSTRHCIYWIICLLLVVSYSHRLKLSS